MQEVEEAMAALNQDGSPKIAILHCCSNYPAALEEVNLKAMASMRERFGCVVGYSDHTMGNEVACLAIGMGAKVLEKHFTYDVEAPGPDHKASLSPTELKEYIAVVRKSEMILGDGVKRPQPSELETKKVVQKFVVAAKDIPAGTVLDSPGALVLF